ncbi:MAG: hypothetical protein Alpg2KO_01510 [Alphaproteobacteria bacterium]
MQNQHHKSDRRFVSRRGATLSGYGLVVGLIAIVALVSTTGIGSSISTLFGGVSSDLEATRTGSAGGGTPTAEESPTDELFTFTSHDFTNCGAVGTSGPSLNDCRSFYSPSGDWDEDTAYFDVSNGIQIWTAPQTGSYALIVDGADGGEPGGPNGGKGARLTTSIGLQQGDKIRMLIGQAGGCTGEYCGGGGGTFVFENLTTPLVIAGGGGGGGGNGEGCDAGLTTSSNNCSGNGYADKSDGTGGVSTGNWGGGGGGGWLGAGAIGHCGNQSNPGTGTGGADQPGAGGQVSVGCSYGTAGFGGFGGGGGPVWGPGGGGGYTGGAARNAPGNNNDHHSGGGGGSFVGNGVVEIAAQVKDSWTGGPGNVRIILLP